MTESQTVLIPRQVGKYVFQGTIGEGAFSIVKLVRREDTSEYFACKIIPRSRMNEAVMKRFEREIRINQQMHHPGVVSLVDVYTDMLNYYIIIEFCPNGDLFDYIVSHGMISERECKSLFMQLLRILEFIHSQGVCHRDLKPENILIDKMGRLRISDFGLSRFVPQNALVETSCGSPCYASPECISGKPYDGMKSDVWSLGVIFYVMSTGQLPWTKRNLTSLYTQIRTSNFKIPPTIGHDLSDLILNMMNVDPNQRYSIDQLLAHPFFYNSRSQTFFQNDIPLVSLKKIDELFNDDIDICIPKKGDFKTNSHADKIYSKLVQHIKEVGTIKIKTRYSVNETKNGYRYGKKDKPKNYLVTESIKREALSNIREISNRRKNILLPELNLKELNRQKIPTPRASIKKFKFRKEIICPIVINNKINVSQTSRQ